MDSISNTNDTSIIKIRRDSGEFIIRKMTPNDIDEALAVFATHRMYESAVTVRAFLSCDPNGFYVAVNANTGKVVGVCAAPVLKESQGFFGLYGVLSEHQNKGIGKQLFDLCLQHIGDNNCGLHAVSSMFDKYSNKAGFSVRENRSLVVIYGFPNDLDIIKPKNIADIAIITFKEIENSRELLNKIIDYDSKVHLFNREKVLTLYLSSDVCFTIVAVDNTSPDNTVIGFGCIKPDSGNNAMLGPVYADNDLIAEALIFNLIKHVNLSETNGLNYVTLDTPDGGLKIARKLGLNEAERCERLFTKFPIPAKHELIYLIHSPEFSL